MIEKVLPYNWIALKIDELTTIVSGGTPSTTKPEYFDGNIPWITPADLSGYNEKYIEKGRRNISDLGLRSSSARLLPKDTVLFSSRAPIGYVAIAKNELCTNQGFKNLLPSDAFDSSYAYYYLKHIKEFAESQASGTTFKELSGKKMGELPFLLPPIAEQKRIVDKLDAVTAHLDSLKAKLERIPELLKSFRQAVLTKAVTGKLTEEWRKDNKSIETAEELLRRIQKRRIEIYKRQCLEASKEGRRKPRQVFSEVIPVIDYGITTEIPDSWTITNIDYLAFVTKLAGFEYTNYIKFKEEGDIPVIRAQNVQMGRFVEENLVYIDKETSDFLERSQLHGREVLMVFIGAGTGNVCLAPRNRRWHLAPNVAKIDVDGISAEYLNYYLQSSVGFENTMSFIKATAQPSLSMETIRQIVVQLPPLEEQKEIVRRIQVLFAKADAIESQYLSLKEKVDKLPQALLAKAFRGELVPQHEADEPASVLLDKIKQLKQGLAKTKKEAPVGTRGKKTAKRTVKERAL